MGFALSLSGATFQTAMGTGCLSSDSRLRMNMTAWRELGQIDGPCLSGPHVYVVRYVNHATLRIGETFASSDVASQCVRVGVMLEYP